jgi:hypothetical protein
VAGAEAANTCPQDVAQQKVRLHASSSMMSSMMGRGGDGPPGPRESSIEAEDVE